jgi:hypothetical protein
VSVKVSVRMSSARIILFLRRQEMGKSASAHPTLGAAQFAGVPYYDKVDISWGANVWVIARVSMRVRPGLIICER